MSLEAIVSRIETRLEKTGKKQSEALKEAGLSRDYVRNFKRTIKGELEVQSPKIDSLQRLAEVLGTTFEWLAAGAGPEEPTAEPPELRAIIDKLREASPGTREKTEKFIDMLEGR